jgi:acyl-CoA reductase-like NAD-dependent aldehyde dehydrogenase
VLAVPSIEQGHTVATSTDTGTDAAGGWPEREFFEVRSPSDGRVVASLPVYSPADVAATAAELRAAQPAWEEAGPAGRAKALRRWLDWIMDNDQRLLELVQAESGKSWGDTAIETMVAIEMINWVTKYGAEWLADEDHRPRGPANATKKLRTHIRPYQLVGVITPWNFPLGMPMLDIPAALMSGAAVLSKPSEVTPLAWAEAVRGWREEIDAPPVLACATGLGATGAAVVEQVDMVQFTGSTRTGRAIAVRAAERLIPCSLELGGKDAMIVLDDADIDRAVGGAIWGGLFNSGQACISVERVYVQAPVYDEFVGKLTARAAEIRQGTDTDRSFRNDIGAMANQSQVDIVDRHVRDAVAKGAQVLTGGKPGDRGCYYPPTVLVDVDHTMDCMREETFGPTLPVMKVDSEEEAIRLANDSPYGLCGSVWTTDPKRAERVARQLDTGGVTANNVLASVFQFPLPMGGWKQSGLGARNGGPYTVRKFCRTQSYVSERVMLRSEANWYPYRAGKSRMMARVVRLLGLHDWRRRLGLRPKH